MNLKLGDKVQLKSGGPLMTIHRIIGANNGLFDEKTDSKYFAEGFENGDVICEWFNRKNLEREPFKINSLLKVS